MLNKHDLGITPHIENNSFRDQSLVRMGTSQVTLYSLASAWEELDIAINVVILVLGTQLPESWSNFFFLIDSGYPLGQYYIIDVHSFVRNASWG